MTTNASAPPPTATPPTPPPVAPTVPALKDIIWTRFSLALDIKRRVHVLRAFSDELDRTSRGKPFRIRNDIVWNAVLDIRDKLVIDLYSLTVEMRHGMRPLEPGVSVMRSFLRKRGLFIELRDNYCASFTRSYTPQPGESRLLGEPGARSRAAAFDRLFPGCATDSPGAHDVEALCERFRLRMVPLGQDRNKNRAHALEGDAGTARMHSVPDLEALFEYVEQLLRDLALVSARTGFGGNNMNSADCADTAADLVDQILIGHISDIRGVITPERTRDELYAQLHQIDDDASAPTGNETPLYFNDRRFRPPFMVPYVRAVSPA
jgi:hypothetical protein